MTLLLPVLSLGLTQLAIGRSELVALNVGDVEFVPEGLVLIIRLSKTVQERASQCIVMQNGRSILTCPVRSL